jgi:hypothetical protein
MTANNWSRYTSVTRHFQVRVPIKWNIVEDEKSLSIESPNKDVAVIVTVFINSRDKSSIDTREHMDRYLGGQDFAAGPVRFEYTPAASLSEYTDAEGALWRVLFLSESEVLVLATANGQASPQAQQLSLEILRSIQILQNRTIV